MRVITHADSLNIRHEEPCSNLLFVLIPRKANFPAMCLLRITPLCSQEDRTYRDQKEPGSITLPSSASPIWKESQRVLAGLSHRQQGMEHELEGPRTVWTGQTP